MKKIILTIGDISIVGGAERVVVNLANALTELGYNTEILSFYKKNEKVFYPIDERIKVSFYNNMSEEAVKQKYSKFYFKNFYKIVLSYKMKKYIRGADVVIGNCDVFFPYFKNKNTKYVRIKHERFHKFHKRYGYFDNLVVPSIKQETIWNSHYKSVIVIPNFLENFSPKTAACENKIILAAGRVSVDKGIDRLLDIFATLAHEYKEWQLYIVGDDGGYKADAASKIKALGLSKQIILKPSTKDVESEYLNAGIYAMSSRFEGMPMVLLEACSYGLPCVSFDILTGPSDILDDGKCGILVPDGDNKAFANALKSLMDSHEKRLEMGTKAKKFVTKTFSKEAIMKKWVELIEN